VAPEEFKDTINRINAIIQNSLFFNYDKRKADIRKKNDTLIQNRNYIRNVTGTEISSDNVGSNVNQTSSNHRQNQNFATDTSRRNNKKRTRDRNLTKKRIEKAFEMENICLYHKLGYHWSLGKQKCQNSNLVEYVRLEYSNRDVRYKQQYKLYSYANVLAMNYYASLKRTSRHFALTIQ
ncbi:unnamed protein product, partial [Gordionus sp. m RMFG-2023]